MGVLLRRRQKRGLVVRCVLLPASLLRRLTITAQRRNRSKRRPRNERVSFVHTIASTFPAPSFVVCSDVSGHQLCYQIDGKEGAYLSVFPTPLVALPPTPTSEIRHSVVPYLFRDGRCGRKTSPTPSPARLWAQSVPSTPIGYGAAGTDAPPRV